MSARLINWNVVNTTPYNAAANSKLLVNTSSPKIINLPSSPSVGDEVRIVDADGLSATNNITVASSNKIRNSDSDFVIDVNEAGVGFVYYSLNRGWILTEK